jgi:type II secretory pathway predicted ATPase ExeA
MLLGRERELELLTGLIRDRRRLVVTGEAGVGKTTDRRLASAKRKLGATSTAQVVVAFRRR